MENRAIIIFVKHPRQGFVKTRLAACIGNYHATELYKCFLSDLDQTLNQVNCRKIISFTPNDERALMDIKKHFSNNHTYLPQRGNNLGDRIIHAFDSSFKLGFSKLVLIGSDSPQLPFTIFKKAFAALENNFAVLGPSTDGGYYLIGFQKKNFSKIFFKDITWSSTHVLEQTETKLKDTLKTYFLLEECADIDDLDDLKVVYTRLNKTSATFNYITNNNLYK